MPAAVARPTTPPAGPPPLASKTAKRRQGRSEAADDGHPVLGSLVLSQSDYDATSPRALQPLRSYRYVGVDHSPISRYILTPYWNAVVKLFPLWMAPNTITTIGFSLMLLSVAILALCDPQMTNGDPHWIYYYFSVSLWIYSTLDNIDGKQARRTGSSSPLGELFDHGCDSLNSVITAMIQAASFGIGRSSLYYVSLLFALWGFYCPTWQEYHTGVLHLGYVNGPTEGVIAACIGLFISGYHGPSVWHRPLAIGGGHTLMPLHAALLVYSAVFFGSVVPTAILSVRSACRNKGQSFPAALMHFVPLTCMTVFGYLWAFSPHSAIRTDHAMLFTVTVGIVFAKTATKVILAHLTRQPYPTYSRLMAPLVLGAVLSRLGLFPKGSEHAMLWLYFAFVLVAYLVWAQHIVASFSRFLGIHCFSLRKRASSTRLGTDETIKTH